jgi:GT2 family glycosyltransferase
MRVAFVALSTDELRRMPACDALIAPPEVSRDAHWFDGPLGAPAPSLLPGARAAHALRMLRAFDEIRSSPEGAWAIAAALRSGGMAGRLIVQVAPGHASLVRPLELGVDHHELLRREVLLAGLRDAHEIVGDADAIEALRQGGAQLAVPDEEPAWPADRQPGITAVVTHKDLGRYLPACLASLRAQTVPVEILLVDDGSGPEGLAVVAAEERKDPAMRVLRRKNGGLGDARNFGVDNARTGLILIVDADNVMHPELAERLRETLRRRPWAASATAGFRLFHDGSGETVFFYSPAELSERGLFLMNSGGDACAMHRREALASVRHIGDPSFSEDWEMWLRYLERGLRTAPVHEALFDYRVRGDSKARSRAALLEAAMRPRIAAEHPRLLAKNARDVALLVAAELHRIEASERAAMVHARDEGAARAAAQAEMERARAEARRATERAEVLEASLVRAESRSAALQERLSDERARNAALRAALDGMASSSAVRLSRALHGISPAAHHAVGRALQLALGRHPRKAQ